MDQKTTGDLSNELMSDASLDSYLSSNQASFFDCSIADLLSGLYQKKSITKAALARKAGISEVYLHQVFSGRRTPSRDRLISLCIGLEATLEETQELLKRASYAQLYPRLKRDAVICHGIVHHTALGTINDNLFEANEDTLL